MLKRVADLTSDDFQKALNTVRNFFSLKPGESPNMMDVKANYDGSIEKRLGTNTQNSVIIAASAGASWSVDVAGTLTANLQAFWKLEEPSSTRLDSFGGNNLTDNNGVSRSGGIRNAAASFTAANSQYLLISNTSTLTGNGNFSVSSWINLASTSLTLQRIIASKSDSPYGGIDSNTQLMLHFDGAQGSTVFTDSSKNNYSIALGGTPIIDTAQSKFGGASGKFGGTGDFLDASNGINAFQIQQSDFTIDLQVRFNSISQNNGFCGGNDDSTSSYWIFLWKSTTNGNLVFKSLSGGATTHDMTFAWSPSANTWYHVALVRTSTTWLAFVDGTTIGSPISNNSSFGIFTNQAQIGRATGEGATPSMNGWIDEFRMTKGIARYTSNFSAPIVAYTFPRAMEYILYVDTDNKATFDVSSSGTVANASVKANSFGVLTTSTWYNVVGYLDSTNGFVGVSVNLHLNSAAYTSGIMSSSAPFVLGSVSNGALSFMDGLIDETGYWKKVLTLQNRTDLYNAGAGNTYTKSFDNQPWASFDFGASANRWLMVSAGTGVYASSNLGVSWVSVATDRTATYQYMERSKNVLIATSDAYDTPLAWSGSSNTFMTIVNSNAPACKISVNYQGYLILMNSSLRKRGFFFEDENTQLTGTWATAFDLPSSYDDEITSAFILKKRLYVSTRYKLFNVSFVGGNPVWRFDEMKDWGFVSRTADRLALKDIGEVVIGLDWGRKIRLFDGYYDRIISDNIEFDNNYCEFATSKIPYSGSGIVISFAETDVNKNIYKLCVAIGENSSLTTHFVNFDGRTMGFYPDSNRLFNTMTMAESSNRKFLMAFDRSGYCHMLDSGNKDSNTTAINDIYDSPLLFDKSPSQSQKTHKGDFYFFNTTAGKLFLRTRIDFDDTFKTSEPFVISGSDKKITVMKSIDIPQGQNSLQYRITSSKGTTDPWILIRHDIFEEGLGIGKNQ